MDSFKEKVVTNAKKQLAKRREDSSKAFKDLYDQKRGFSFPEEVNTERYFYLPQPVLREMELSKTALSIYPVLCSCADFKVNEWFPLPQEHIAKMAGLSVATVSKGIKELVAGDPLIDNSAETPLLQKRLVTNNGRRFYTYKVGFIRQNMIGDWKREMLLFHTCIIDSGVWAKLNSRAKVLYLSLRINSHFDPELFDLIEGINLAGYELDEFYKDGNQYRNRKWDVCEYSLSELCRGAGISTSNLKSTLNMLEKYGLAEIEKADDWNIIKVYLKPKGRYVV